MSRLARQVRLFLTADDGPTSVEYAVMIALILLVCLSAITAVGTQAAGQFNNVATIVGTGGS